MLLNTRRRMLGLLAAAIGAPRLVQLIPSAFAAETEQKPASKKPECFALQAFGDWKGTATNKQAGARIGQVTFSDPDACDLRAEIQVAASYDAKLVIFGDPDGTPLPKDFLVKPDNRIIAKNEDGTTAVDEPLCGVCTDIRDDKVSIVLPLSTGALFRSAKSVEMAVKLGDAEECTLHAQLRRFAQSPRLGGAAQGRAGEILRRKEMHAAGQRLLPDHRLLRGAWLERRLLRAPHPSPLSRPRAHCHAGRPCRPRRLLSCGAVDTGAASATGARGQTLVGLHALHSAERRGGAAWLKPSRLFSLCAHDG